VSESRLRTLVVRYLAVTPSELLRQLRAGEGLALKLEYREPFPLADCLDYLGRRGFRGVEEVSGDVYRRTFRARGGPGMLELGPADDGHVAATITGAQPDELPAIVAGARRTLDLDADPAVVDADLAGDPRLSSTVRLKPGLRLTGAFDPFELAVRAILGQQISVQGATTLAGRLVERFGEPLAEPSGSLTHLFPSPSTLAEAPVESIGMPRAKGGAIRALAQAVDGGLELGPGADPAELRGGLVALPGIGPWTAEYVAMRAAGDPDGWPASDLGLRIALGNGKPATEREVARAGEAWRPWRSYAAMRLWWSLGTAG
jgi:AraC family transcriptional regulator of adaptative response / DNA-3-methyladenine glycosylase II